MYTGKSKKKRKVAEDDPGFNPRTMGNKRGYGKDGTYYEGGKKSKGARNYSKGSGRPS